MRDGKGRRERERKIERESKREDEYVWVRTSTMDVIQIMQTCGVKLSLIEPKIKFSTFKFNTTLSST